MADKKPKKKTEKTVEPEVRFLVINDDKVWDDLVAYYKNGGVTVEAVPKEDDDDTDDTFYVLAVNGDD